VKLQFESYEDGFGSELKCPSCGFNYLHHHKIEVFEREEDAEYGLHVVIHKSAATTDPNLSGNPSGRRHGLAIHFLCEGCQSNSILTIAQHKGNTWIDIN